MKRLTQRGRHTVLPIVGERLTGVKIGLHRLPELIFGERGDESCIQIEDPVILLKRGRHEIKLKTREPHELTVLVELIGVADLMVDVSPGWV